MGRRIITTDTLEEDIKIEGNLTTAFRRLYRSAKSKRDVKDLY